MAKVYGIPIILGETPSADELLTMANSDEEKRAIVETYGDKSEVYTLEGFFYYLNADRIDTENYYWICIN